MKGFYQEQIKRTIRSFNKLPVEKVLKRIDVRTEDNFYHFFQDCYHLRDWIINDSLINKRKKIMIQRDLDDYINKNEYLKIISGIANATKHLKLIRKQRRGISKRVGIGKIQIGNGYSIVITYGIGKNRKSILAHSLAIFAIQEWRIFLLNNKLENFNFDRQVSSLI